MINMKKIFFFCFLGSSVFAGREFIQADVAREKLWEFVRQLNIIRVQMNFRVRADDFADISIEQRIKQIRKFDTLFRDFKHSKEYFKKNFTTSIDKVAFIFCILQMDEDKKRYDKEFELHLIERLSR